MFSVDNTNCPATSSTSCSIPISTLRASPFNLDDSDSVTARVKATNTIGDSGFGSGNGAQIPLTLSTPSAPQNLVRVDDYLDKTQIQISWNVPASDGNASIIDYRVEYAIGTGSYQQLATGITTTSLTASSLSAGTSYKFKVQARNSEGFGIFSNELTTLAA